MKYLYLLSSITITLATHTLQSAALDQLSTSPRYQALPPVPLTESPQTRCCSRRCLRPTRAVLCYVCLLGGLVLTGFTLNNSGYYSKPTPFSPLVCTRYSRAYALECSNNCSTQSHSQGFELKYMCHLPQSAHPSTQAQLESICHDSKGLTIEDYRRCTWRPLPPCTPSEPAIQKLNKTCSKPTPEELRQKHHQNLTVMATNREPGTGPASGRLHLRGT